MLLFLLTFNFNGLSRLLSGRVRAWSAGTHQLELSRYWIKADAGRTVTRRARKPQHPTAHLGPVREQRSRAPLPGNHTLAPSLDTVIGRPHTVPSDGDPPTLADPASYYRRAGAGGLLAWLSDSCGTNGPRATGSGALNGESRLGGR